MSSGDHPACERSHNAEILYSNLVGLDGRMCSERRSINRSPGNMVVSSTSLWKATHCISIVCLLSVYFMNREHCVSRANRSIFFLTSTSFSSSFSIVSFGIFSFVWTAAKFPTRSSSSPNRDMMLVATARGPLPAW
ncbi:hypothetical protein B0H16DRAFT_1533681 [Mycena metata]|uniref:Uncharacterized protein n=1 Tax=Mycena metata TaxID=1033252 RepID=A0AAD7NF73_9AGAR|nr:hypothetical protein B0H16DRAFT_1533681 [Mycena metata]